MNSEDRIEPFQEEIDEAKRTPGGWVYRIDGKFDSNAPVPPERIVGAWKTDANGKIVGQFMQNPRYKKS